MTNQRRVCPFIMTLTMSSHDVPMGPIVQSMGLVAKHLYVRGQPMVNLKYPSERPAAKHYASIADLRSSDEKDVSMWLDRTIWHINDHSFLVSLVQSGQVEVMLWVSVLHDDPTPPPLAIDQAIINAAMRLGATILIEDYNRQEPITGAPLKVLLGKPLATARVNAG